MYLYLQNLLYGLGKAQSTNTFKARTHLKTWATRVDKTGLGIDKVNPPWMNKYIQITFHEMLMFQKMHPSSMATPIIEKLDQALLQLHSTYFPLSREEFDINGIRVLSHQSLLLIGNENAGTAVHLDWSLAVNLAIGIDAELGTVVAKWLCCEGNKAAQSWLVDYCCKLRQQKEEVLPELTVSTMEAIVLESTNARIGRIWIEDQKSGDIFKIPCGTAHAVCNIHPCIKIAMDGVESFNTYAEMMVVQSKLISPVFSSRMVEDYAGVAPKLSSSIHEFFEDLLIPQV